MKNTGIKPDDCPTLGYHDTHRYCPSCDWDERMDQPVVPPLYEVTVMLPLDLYDEDWFDRVADAAGDYAAVSGRIVPQEADRGR